MVGRARPFARLAGIVDAAEIVTGDQATVALVSGEAGIGKTRLVRELVDSLPSRVTTVAITAQPGSMGRPLDAVAGLVGPGVVGDDVATAVFDLVAAAVGRGPCVLVVEDLHWVDAASANLIDRIAQQPWPNLVVIATYRPNDLSARPARRRARAASRTPPLRRAGPSRPPRPHRGRGDGRGDLARHRWPAVVGVHRGAAPAQRRHPVRRRGADARRRPATDGGGPARGRAAVVAGGSGAPAARRARARAPAGRRGTRRVRPGGVVRGLARRHRSQRRRPDRRPALARRRRRRRRGQRRPVLVLPRARGRCHRPPAARPRAAAAARALLRGRAAGPGPRPRVVGVPRPGRRPARRGARHRPARRGALPREGAHVLGPAARRRGPVGGPERLRAAGRRDRGRVAARLRGRGPRHGDPLGEGRRRAARPHRRPALHGPSPPRAGRRAGVHRPARRARGAVVVARRPAAARRGRLVAGPGPHDQSPVAATP